jgi:sugar/nucleoside kinase (ribokinase family)
MIAHIAEMRADEVQDEWLRKATHLHVSSYYLQKALRPGCRHLFERATALGLTTSLDPGFDPEQKWEDDVLETLQHVDVFLPNEQELEAITGLDDLSEALASVQNGRTRTVVKRGSEGCASLDDGLRLDIPAYAVDAIDSTGAGDSFDAGFLHAWLRKLSWLDCMRWGSACGSLSTRGIGGTTAQATADQALKVMVAKP